MDTDEQSDNDTMGGDELLTICVARDLIAKLQAEKLAVSTQLAAVIRAYDLGTLTEQKITMARGVLIQANNRNLPRDE